MVESKDTDSAKEGSADEAKKDVPIDYSNYGYDLYPQRRGEPAKKSWWDVAFGYQGKELVQSIRCERNVYDCFQRSKPVKLMVAAFKSAGCDFDIRRHISCEVCDASAVGGYDPILNQVVICQNTADSKNKIHSTLMHELIHMFDYCRNEMDFRNLDHLACTEIRAANLTNCNFTSSWYHGTSSPINIKGTQKNCVKLMACNSIMTARKVSKEEAMAAINRVFTRCYNDLEPIGRRIRKNSDDIRRIYDEGPLYGYNV